MTALSSAVMTTGKAGVCVAPRLLKMERSCRCSLLSAAAAGLVYHQEIEIYEYDNLIEVSGECTCPVGINCKHVVAVLCELIASHSVKASSGGIDQPVDEWLELAFKDLRAA